jgi:glycosyltransferase involved in cell wall biosynthesis
MHLIRLVDLPVPPAGRVGWPWTEESFPSSSVPSKNREWPRVSVITPSFNQARFVEQTLRSVLLQNYPNLEYIIIDGGSRDGSVEIIKKYEQHLAHFESEPDRGQSHAINKGFARATGDIICWLNSDDYYLPGTLHTVAEVLGDGQGNFALVGNCVQVYDDGRPPFEGKGRYESLDRLLQFWKGYQMHQPSIFWRREVFDRVGYLDESLHYCMDFDYWVRIARHFPFQTIDRALSNATYHREAKTGDNFTRYNDEQMRIAPGYWPHTPGSYYRMKFSMYSHMVLKPRARRLLALSRYYPRRAWSLLVKNLVSRASEN